MGFLDNAKDKLAKAVDQHGHKISDGIDKASKVIDDKTGGKHSVKIASGSARAKDALDKLDGKNDDIRDTTTPPEPYDPTIPTHPAPVDPTDPIPPGPPTDPANPTGSPRP
ncbi:antitoxin [Nocardioides sp. InS609-2]|uniref:antitoxin n=1 Tax=Nocardioides sp. InS609-2 TaxID=2760705 RepID=UPI0020C13FA2|nr:antitoxin [Nocardioides sp. InS609-2]